LQIKPQDVYFTLQEKRALQQDTVELMLKAKLHASRDVENIRHNITSEYRLKLSALVNQYLDRKAALDADTTQKKQEKTEVNSKPKLM
jgi:hypothetical protein